MPSLPIRARPQPKMIAASTREAALAIRSARTPGGLRTDGWAACWCWIG